MTWSITFLQNPNNVPTGAWYIPNAMTLTSSLTEDAIATGGCTAPVCHAATATSTAVVTNAGSTPLSGHFTVTINGGSTAGFVQVGIGSVSHCPPLRIHTNASAIIKHFSLSAVM